MNIFRTETRLPRPGGISHFVSVSQWLLMDVDHRYRDPWTEYCGLSCYGGDAQVELGTEARVRALVPEHLNGGDALVHKPNDACPAGATRCIKVALLRALQHSVDRTWR